MNEMVCHAIIDRILEREGGVADVDDGAGLTRWGQTIAWLTSFQLPIPSTIDEAALNYRKWLEMTKLDALCDQDDAFADIVIDYAVNSGHGRAIRTLQNALGVHVDGVIGPKTISAVEALSDSDRRFTAGIVLCDQIERDGQNITNDPSNAAFAYGWSVRRVNHLKSLLGI